MEDRKNRRAAIRYGLITFVASAAVLSLLLTLQFLLKWEGDIFGKQLPAGHISGIVFLGWVSTIPMVLPVAGMAGSLMGLRCWFRTGDRKLVRSLSAGFAIALIFATLSFSWVSFGAPRVNLEMLAQLFDIRKAEPGKPMEHTSRELFRGNPQTSNLTELSGEIDSLRLYGDHAKENLRKDVERFADEKLLTKILEHPVAKKYELSANDFGTLHGEIAGNPNDSLSMVVHLDVYRHKMEHMNRSILDYEMERQKMFWHPLYFMMLCVAGMLLGVLSQKIHAAFVLAGLFFLLMPGFFYADIFFAALTKNGFFSPLEGRLYFMLVLLIFTVILGLGARFTVRKDRVNIP